MHEAVDVTELVSRVRFLERTVTGFCVCGVLIAVTCLAAWAGGAVSAQSRKSATDMITAESIGLIDRKTGVVRAVLSAGDDGPYLHFYDQKQNILGGIVVKGERTILHGDGVMTSSVDIRTPTEKPGSPFRFLATFGAVDKEHAVLRFEKAAQGAIALGIAEQRPFLNITDAKGVSRLRAQMDGGHVWFEAASGTGSSVARLVGPENGLVLWAIKDPDGKVVDTLPKAPR